MDGLIHIYCGVGKGKTTASIGLAIRAAGAGKKVVFSQFLKCGNSSELNILKAIKQISVETFSTVPDFYSKLSKDEQQKAKNECLAMFKKLISVSKNADLLVLDEVISACNKQIIDENELCDFLQKKPKSLEVVLTGRNPSDTLISLANYVTEMKKIKHPYDEGINARLGIEY